MAVFTCNDWQIFFYPLFNTQWVDLREKIKKLKDELPKEEFIQHQDAKLLKALNIGIKKKLPKILLRLTLFYRNLYKNMVVSRKWDFQKDIDCFLEYLKNKK
ncbi:hypothetical protein VB713_15640 [Anabaena cylindrica UHCC 0172]|uniref:hypothetical protein n=1 Tax=Anabaena cylindrica TaxID=1165 RepID=UPI002B1EF8D6|nr:hypothetical protein [Anabaena cylindrica]MEA5552374.1 hypothetical protein [Anabaena cylindrica UHCC 0172]